VVSIKENKQFIVEKYKKRGGLNMHVQPLVNTKDTKHIHHAEGRGGRLLKREIELA